MRHSEPQRDTTRKESLHVTLQVSSAQNKEKILKAANRSTKLSTKANLPE
jgi:hypothetical protein